MFKDNANNVELCFGYGNSPPRVGDVLPQEKYRHLTSVLIDAIVANTVGPSSSPTREFACRICEGILLQPVTIACGHTFCRGCLARDTSRSCRQCGPKIASACMLQTNVLMKGLSEKWWPEDVRAARLREQGNELFQRNKIYAVLAKYGEALQIGECSDHVSSLFCRTAQYSDRVCLLELNQASVGTFTLSWNVYPVCVCSACKMKFEPHQTDLSSNPLRNADLLKGNIVLE